MSAAPDLSLCMIVRDSARTLAACLDSIRPWVDEMIVVDTGSVDDTRQIAHDRGAQVFEFPWIDDFSAARNESLRRANGKWIFWMDSDDTIDDYNGRGLRELAERSHEEYTLGYVLQVHCPAGPSEDGDTTVVDHVKLIRNDPRIRFEGRIHEQVLPSIRQLGGEVDWTDLFVVHSGADQSAEGKSQKQQRDLRILELDLLDRPDHPFVLFNLGMTYEDMGQYATAEVWLRKCLAQSAVGESHLRKAYALLVSCLERTCRFHDACEICREGLKHFPGDKELLFRLGLLEHRAGNRSASVAAYQQVLHSNGFRHFTSVDQGITSYKARHNLALVYADDGNQSLAELQWRHVVDCKPRFAPALRGLGQALVNQGKLAATEMLIEELHQLDSEADCAWLSALIAERRGQAAQVRPLLEEALAIDPNHLQARQDYCRWLFHYGSLVEAESALRILVECSTDKGPALYNLGIVLSRQGKNNEALAVLTQSLELRPDSTSTRHALRELQEQSKHDAASLVNFSNSSIAERPPIANALPVCYARRVIPGDDRRYFCLHPKVSSRGQVVTPAICGICTRWMEPRPERLRPESDLVPADRGLFCQFMGRQTGLRQCPTCAGNVQVKVFSCSHPNHSDTTLEECRSCSDFLINSPSANALSVEGR